MWTHYQPEEASEAILANTLDKLILYGFRVLVLLAGHGPWHRILERHVPALQEAHPDRLFLWGNLKQIGGEVRIPDDHAAREETSYGLALFSQWVDLDAMRPGRDNTAWPNGQPPPEGSRHLRLCYDPNEPLYAQVGVDARTATAERGERNVTRLVEHLAPKINDYLDGGD